MLVATRGVFLSIHISFEQWFLGDGGCTARPSSKIESSCNQRKSFKNMISTFSAPRRSYLSLAGLLKVLNIFCKGDKKNVSPQLARCPTTKMFLNLSILLVRSSRMAIAKATGSTLFLWRNSRAQPYQLPEHS